LKKRGTLKKRTSYSLLAGMLFHQSSKIQTATTTEVRFISDEAEVILLPVAGEIPWQVNHLKKEKAT
jgi:hypothetical protein